MSAEFLKVLNYATPGGEGTFTPKLSVLSDTQPGGRPRANKERLAKPSFRPAHGDKNAWGTARSSKPSARG